MENLRTENSIKSVYLASRWSRKAELAAYADDLRAAGIKVTSRWLTAGIHEELVHPDDAWRFAEEDVLDVVAADTLILFGDMDQGTRGGKFVEFGLALAWGLRLIVVGETANIFCKIRTVSHFDGWPAALSAITTINASTDSGLSPLFFAYLARRRRFPS